MVISAIADNIWRGVEAAQSSVNEALFEPVVRLGVTGLARSGKTVFITSLVANMLERGRMGGMDAVASGRLHAAYLQPQPDDTVPRFDYEGHMARLAADPPVWPESTRAISELRLSFRVQPTGLLAGMTGPRIVHLDIVDYPGEWLLDLTLMDRSYEEWASEVLSRLSGRDFALKFLEAVDETDGEADFEEMTARRLAELYTETLHAARDAGLSDCAPGRFLLPGDLAGSPALTFAPLRPPGRAPRGSMAREMARRFEAYKRSVVRPFFRDHFARIDRQVVLVDLLTAIHSGPQAVADMRRAMSGILSAFRPGRNAFLSQILRGKRVEKILFAATKADHLHHRQHGRMTAIINAMLRDARARAEFAGAETAALAIAALRATVEESRGHGGMDLQLVRGTLPDGRQVALHAGDLPDDPARVLAEAGGTEASWLDDEYEIMAFAPPARILRDGMGPPHIRLDRAAEFLFGDRL